MSNTSSPADTSTALDCIARANPAISLAVSPFARSKTKNAEICVGSASNSASIAAYARSSDKSTPAHKSSITARRSTAFTGADVAKTTPPFVFRENPPARVSLIPRRPSSVDIIVGTARAVDVDRIVALVALPRVVVAFAVAGVAHTARVVIALAPYMVDSVDRVALRRRGRIERREGRMNG